MSGTNPRTRSRGPRARRSTCSSPTWSCRAEAASSWPDRPGKAFRACRSCSPAATARRSRRHGRRFRCVLASPTAPRPSPPLWARALERAEHQHSLTCSPCRVAMGMGTAEGWGRVDMRPHRIPVELSYLPLSSGPAGRRHHDHVQQAPRAKRSRADPPARRAWPCRDRAALGRLIGGVERGRRPRTADSASR